MKVFSVNTVYGEGSTGNISQGIHDLCKEENIEYISACRNLPASKDGISDCIAISTPFDSKLHGVLSRFTMLKGCFSYSKTRKLIKYIKSYSPDIIHLHNLHGSYVNIPLLTKYIKKHNISVVFTLHDCWAMTAICSHFSIAGCNRWQDGCHNCPQRKKYSSCPFDFTKKVYKLKKKWFTGFNKAVVVTPSEWLSGVAKKSFLKDYEIKTIYNGINLDVFKPTISDFKKKHNIQDKKMVLGVAYGWGYSKGIDAMIEISHRLPKDKYAMVLVGVDENTKSTLPENIIAISKTANQKELAEIYTSADVFVNTTREEVLGLVNIEALACGAPVVTFNSGGSPECIDSTCGSIVEKDDIDALEKEIIRICETNPFAKISCIKRAELFDKNKRLREYLELYKSIL
ncbi:MAG: glycosyltransferase [Ruminococcaceae bacterium]|nr:glycosyltransferase [Oscillospiraceae bacterium]